MNRFEKEGTPLLEYGFKQGQIDKFIYKYRNIHQVDMFLDNSKLKFSVHSEFNDPFDCSASISTKNTLVEIQEFLKLNNTPEYMINSMARNFFKDDASWRKIIIDAINSEIDNTGIFCGTTNCKNHLMWAHYADFNKGACLKFDMSKDLDFFFFPKKIIYKKDFPKYNYIKEPQMVAEQLFRKSCEWEYEDEVRIIKRGCYGLREVNKDALVEIIFGCKTPKDEIKQIVNKAKASGYNVSFKQAQISDSDYNYNIIDL